MNHAPSEECLKNPAPARSDQCHASGGKEGFDLAFQVAATDKGVQVFAGACCCREIAVAGDRARVDVEMPGCPGKDHRQPVQLSCRRVLGLEVAFEDDEEVAIGVVARTGVTAVVGVARSVHEPRLADDVLVSDVSPPSDIHVMSLPPAEPRRTCCRAAVPGVVHGEAVHWRGMR